MNNPNAGWYADPSQAAGQLRWWTGSEWTNDVRQTEVEQSPAPGSAPLPVPAPDPQPLPSPDPLPSPPPAPAPAPAPLHVGSSEFAAPLVLLSGRPFPIAVAPTIEVRLAIGSLSATGIASVALAASLLVGSEQPRTQTGLAFFVGCAFVVSLVSLCVLTSRMYLNVATLGEQPSTLNPAWAAVAWILPIANFTLPFTVLDEIEFSTSAHQAQSWWAAQSTRPPEHRLVMGAFASQASLKSRAARMQVTWYFLLITPFMARLATNDTANPWRWAWLIAALVAAAWAASTSRHLLALSRAQTEGLRNHPGIPSWDYYRMVG